MGHPRADCPFCAIVAGQRDQPIVYADDEVVAFMCVPPATRGHVLVAPRDHVADLWAANEELAASVMRISHRVSLAIRYALEPAGLNVRSNIGARAGQDVFHWHVHLVPRYVDDSVQPGCVWGSAPWQPPAGGAEERDRVARRIRAALEAR